MSNRNMDLIIEGLHEVDEGKEYKSVFNIYHSALDAYDFDEMTFMRFFMDKGEIDSVVDEYIDEMESDDYRILDKAFKFLVSHKIIKSGQENLAIIGKDSNNIVNNACKVLNNASKPKKNKYVDNIKDRVKRELDGVKKGIDSAFNDEDPGELFGSISSGVDTILKLAYYVDMGLNEYEQ